MTQSQIEPPVTANRTERRSATRKRRAPLVLIVVPIVLVALGVVLFQVLGGDGDGVLGIGGDDQSDEVPPFDFRLLRTTAVATVANADLDALEVEAQGTADEIAPTIDELFTNAFLDPTNWRNGDYEEVFALFADAAASSAQDGVETLTLGATAGDVYETVTPRRGSLRFEVLFDRDGNPHTVAVEVSFRALGERTDGTFVAVVSDGELLLQDLDGWTITAFDLERSDEEVEPPAPAPSGSASASPSA